MRPRFGAWSSASFQFLLGTSDQPAGLSDGAAGPGGRHQLDSVVGLVLDVMKERSAASA
jgi:hypothetical protein